MEISEAMPLVHYALSTYLKRHCSGIAEHSDGNVPELCRADIAALSCAISFSKT